MIQRYLLTLSAFKYFASVSGLINLSDTCIELLLLLSSLNEKLKYWLYQEEVYEEMIQDPFFADYRMEQCQQDLMMLTEWKNLNTIQDTKKVASIEEFKNKKYRYQMTEYSVEIERLVIRLENLFIEGASFEPTLLERIRRSVERFPEMGERDKSVVYTWWTDLNNDLLLYHFF